MLVRAHQIGPRLNTYVESSEPCFLHVSGYEIGFAQHLEGHVRTVKEDVNQVFSQAKPRTRSCLGAAAPTRVPCRVNPGLPGAVVSLLHAERRVYVESRS